MTGHFAFLTSNKASIIKMDVKLQGREAAGKILTLFLVFEIECGIFILPQSKLGDIPFCGRGLGAYLLNWNFRIRFHK